MKPRPVAFFVLLSLFLASHAAADEVAPSLESADLRANATLALGFLQAARHDPRLTGVYVAFDPSPSDPSAQVACDDDGDYVVVLSDAMLRLSAEVARVALFDEAQSTHRLDDYAAFLARNQTPGKRILPPAAGSFFTPLTHPSNHDRLFAVLLFIVARELAHVRAGDITCPHPTATKELGDGVWTADEQRAAVATGASIYPGDATARDRDSAAIEELHDDGVDEDGAVSLLRFLARFELESARFSPSYLATHPRSASRLRDVKAAALAHPKKAHVTSVL